MIYFYASFLIYIIGVCFYIDADYHKGFKKRFSIKTLISILYLLIAVFAFLLNRIDGRLVAVSHFKWIFSAMLLYFYGDISMMWRDDKKSFFIGQTAYMIASAVFIAYFTSILLNLTGAIFTLREAGIFVGLFVIILLLTRLKSIESKLQKVFVILVSFIASLMIAKASTLIQFMNTRFSWPLFLGVLLLSISNALEIFEHYAQYKHRYNKGLLNVLHYIGIVILPLGIYYV
jgi:hypothetical protein